MEQEQIRNTFSKACACDDIEQAGFIFSKHLDVESKFSQFTFEQGVLTAVKCGSLQVAKYLLDRENFRVDHQVSVLRYSTLFEFQDEKPNLDILECLCFHLPNKEELLKIKAEESFRNKDHFEVFLNSRLEKDLLDHHVSGPSAATTERKKMKL